MATRRGYIITKSFRSYLTATILTLIIGQVCLTTDGIIMSHLVSPDALSAINLLSPFNMVMATIHALLAIGASVLAGKALGAQDTKSARRIFSVSVYSGLVFVIALSVLCLFFLPHVVRVLCPEERIQPYLSDFMQMYLFVAPISLLSVVLKLFIGVDGNPQLVTKATTVEGLLNVVFDILLVKYLGFGIDGSALATGIGQLVTVCLMIWAIRSSRSRMAFETRIPGWYRLLCANMREGMPTMLGNLVLAAVALGINYIIMDAQGADGVFILSVCMQTMSISMLALSGCGDTVFSVGSVLVGEQDLKGLRILSNRVFGVTCGVTALLMMVVLIWPDGLAELFGASTEAWLELCRTPLREFALMLLPMAIVMLSKYIYQLLGYMKFSNILSAGTFILLPPALLLLGQLSPRHIWLSFPIVSFISLGFQFLALLWLGGKKADIHWFTLIPKESAVTDKISMSVAYDRGELAKAKQEISEFTARQGWTESLRQRVMLVTEELCNNICQHAVAHPRSSQSFDINLCQSTDGMVRLILKDDGILFDPTAQTVSRYTAEQLKNDPTEKIPLGLTLAKGNSSEMSYKSMYGLNVTYVNFLPDDYQPKGESKS